MIELACSNAPLLVQAFDDSISDKDSLLFHILVHCSLDAVEELQRVKDTKQQRASGTQQQLQQHRDGYLGHLSTSDGYRMYGHLTNTNVKIILIMEDRVEEHYFKKTEIQKMLQSLHALYVALVSNPFYQLGSPIKSASFKSSIKKICTGS